MKRWALVAALSLPLPFAALPLVAIAFNRSTPPAPDERPAAFEVSDPVDEQATDPEVESFGLRIDTADPPACEGWAHGS